MVVVILLLTMASAILQDILSDVEQFQSEVNSVLTAEQLDADSIQQLLNSDVIAKIDLPEHIELQRVTTALYLFVTNSAAAWHSNYEQMLLVKKHWPCYIFEYWTTDLDQCEILVQCNASDDSLV